MCRLSYSIHAPRTGVGQGRVLSFITLHIGIVFMWKLPIYLQYFIIVGIGIYIYWGFRTENDYNQSF